MGRLIEGFWNCDMCGKKKISVRYDACPGCGNRRNDDTKYDMLDSKNYVPEKIAATIDRNPDWLCSYCSSLNRANSKTCTCGASKEESEKNYFQIRAEKERKELERKLKLQQGRSELQDDLPKHYEQVDISYDENEYEEENDYTEDNVTNEEIEEKVVSNNTKSISTKFKSFITKIMSSNIPKVALSALGIIAFIAWLVWIFSPKEETLNITSFSWESSISIEEYKTVEESDWTLPSDARLLYTKEEISHYEQVFDHYEIKTKTVLHQELVGYDENVRYVDLGNGYFEEIVEQVPVYDTVYEEVEYQEAVYRDEPVYKTKYYYEIDKWVYKETVTKTGNDKEPYYPEVTFLDNERESSRNQEYFVTGTNEEGEKIKLSLSNDDWEKIKTGQTVKFKVYSDKSAEVIDIEE